MLSEVAGDWMSGEEREIIGSAIKTLSVIERNTSAIPDFTKITADIHL
jgi:hypothetical protein